MTYEEAIKIIKAYKDRLTSSCSNQLDNDIEALDLAIKALTYNAKVDKYGSELAMAYAERKHDEEYLKELEEREKGGAE